VCIFVKWQPKPIMTEQVEEYGDGKLGISWIWSWEAGMLELAEMMALTLILSTVLMALPADSRREMKQYVPGLKALSALSWLATYVRIYVWLCPCWQV